MPRRPVAPRLIGWTGERCVPWAPDVQLVYEHLHRYLWAKPLVTGKAVLDLGSGEGFGAALLAPAAGSVHAIDIDPVAVAHAALRYEAPGLTFAEGDALALDPDLHGRFDVVIAFEVLSGMPDRDALLQAMRSALRPGGVVLLSASGVLLDGPSRNGDGPAAADRTVTELLARHFATQATFGQRVAEGSRIDVLRGTATAAEPAPARITRDGDLDGWATAGAPHPDYVLGVATDGALPAGLGPHTLLDHTLALLDSRLDEQARWDGFPERVQPDQLDDALRRMRLRTLELVGERDRVYALEVEREALRREAALVRESVSWQLLQAARRRWRGSGPQPRAAARLTGAALRGVGAVRAARSAAAARAAERERDALGTAAPVAAPEPPPRVQFTVPTSELPEISIVIPVYSGADITRACLEAIATASLDAPPYEVIVVDDCADRDTKRMLAAIDGIRVLANERNLGFLRSVNRGVEAARGATTVLLNNDTEPQPGWLPALLKRMEHPGVGAVGGRLIYPDGRLQEAGGVLFGDGSAINYGNGQPPDDAAYRFARPVDYCSAALLAIRTDLWHELGGFDEAFSPGYYEDVDLCFRVRRAGHEVWYEPNARIIHKEGGSHGVDVTQGTKRFQVINQVRFVERWGDEVASRWPTADIEAGRLLADRRSSPVVLIVDHIVPEPDRDAGSLRMKYLVDEFLEQGARVVFMPSDRRATPGYTAALEELGVEVLDGTSDVRSRFLQLKESCKLVLVSRPHVSAPLLPELRSFFPGVPVIYDTVDLHWVRELARSTFEDAPVGISHAYREIELALVRATDMTAVVTPEERDAILAEVPGADVRVIPVVQDIPERTPGREERDGVIFVGGFRHHPNVDAATLIATEIMPRLRARGSKLQATIVGPDAPAAFADFVGEGIDVTGWVQDVEPLLDGALAMVAPLRYGAGMKGKVGQALSRGLPVITTAVGAQGFGLVDGQDALLAETPAEFVDAVERLSADPELWARLAAAGPEVVQRSCSRDMMTAVVTRLMAEIATDQPGIGSGNSASVGAPASRSL